MSHNSPKGSFSIPEKKKYSQDSVFSLNPPSLLHLRLISLNYRSLHLPSRCICRRQMYPHNTVHYWSITHIRLKWQLVSFP